MEQSKSIAQFLLQDSIDIITHVPGYGGNQVFSQLNNSPKGFLFYHEEVAFTMAHGAAIIGKRSCCLIKSHGLTKAANSITDALTCGVTAGCVSMVFDDQEGLHSDSIFDCESFIKGMKIPYIKTNGTPLHDLYEAFLLSEQKQLPVIILIQASDVDKKYTERNMPLLPNHQKQYQRNIAQHILCPLLAPQQYEYLQTKLHGNHKENHKMYHPSFDDFPADLLQKIKPYESFFRAFREFRATNPQLLVTGDAGLSCLFAFSPYNAIDITTYMGGSTALALGISYTTQHPCWAITGDFSFIAAGHLGLMESLFKSIPIKLVIICNYKAEATGGQNIPKEDLHRQLSPFKDMITILDKNLSEGDVINGLELINNQPGSSIVLVEI